LVNNDAAESRVRDGAVGVSYAPVNGNDIDYLADTAPNTVTINMVNRLACGVMITNGENAAKYAFEAIAHFEMIGKNCTKTPTDTDVESIGVALGAFADRPMQPTLEGQLSESITIAAMNAQRNKVNLNMENLFGATSSSGSAPRR